MPLTLAALLPLLAQIGPTGTQIQAPLDLPRKKAAVSAPPAPVKANPVVQRLRECLDLTRTDAAAAVTSATAWRNSATGSARVPAGHCLGLALSEQGDFAGAEAAFLAARADVPPSDSADKARLGTMAANAAMAAGGADRALGMLVAAQADARSAADTALAAEVGIDRARALVALKRDGEAAVVLAEARAEAPGNGLAWLLSATLSRRAGKLGEAQAFIEKASAIAPQDPDIGLEAGVIAVLAARDDAARKSWRSVIATAPGSEQAKVAKSYLDQLDPGPTSEGR